MGKRELFHEVQEGKTDVDDPVALLLTMVIATVSCCARDEAFDLGDVRERDRSGGHGTM